MAGPGLVPEERVSVTELRRNLRRYLEQVYFGRQPLVIRRHNDEIAVVLPLDEYRALLARPTARRAQAASASASAPSSGTSGA